MAAFFHSEPHKSNEARIAPLTLTQEMSEEEGEEGRQAQNGMKEKGGREEMYFSSFLSIGCCFYLQELMKGPDWIVSVKTDTVHIQREEANRQRDMDQREGAMWCDAKTILLHIRSPKHPRVKG